MPHVPGAFWAPQIGYVSVASRAIAGQPSGNGRERIGHLLYRSVIGRAAVPGTEGDGLVPVSSTHLDGARTILLDSYIHGPSAGRPWYGSDGAVDVWWPAALEAWQSALEFRAGLRLTAGAAAREEPAAEPAASPSSSRRG